MDEVAFALGHHCILHYRCTRLPFEHDCPVECGSATPQGAEAIGCIRAIW